MSGRWRCRCPAGARIERPAPSRCTRGGDGSRAARQRRVHRRGGGGRLPPGGRGGAQDQEIRRRAGDHPDAQPRHPGRGRGAAGRRSASVFAAESRNLDEYAEASGRQESCRWWSATWCRTASAATTTKVVLFDDRAPSAAAGPKPEVARAIVAHVAALLPRTRHRFHLEDPHAPYRYPDSRRTPRPQPRPMPPAARPAGPARACVDAPLVRAGPTLLVPTGIAIHLADPVWRR